MGLGDIVGKVFGGGGGGDISIPPPTAEERAIQKQQQELVERFAPIFGDFAARAIEGKVPISPALEAELQEREKVTLEDIRRRGGAQAEALTTAGIQRFGALQRGSSIAREEARQRGIALGGQLVGQLGTLTGQALAPLQQQRQMQFQASQFRAQQPRQKGLLSTLAPIGLGALAGPTFGLTALQGAAIGGLGGTSLLPALGAGGGGGTAPLPRLPQATFTQPFE